MKKLTKFLVLVPALLGIAACGGNPEGDSGSDKVTISFFGWGDAEEQENFQIMIDKFMEENPDIKVTYDAVVAGSYPNTLKNKGNKLPDVFYIPDYDFFAYADSGKLLDLSPYLTEEEIASVWPVAIDMYRYDRDTYTLGQGDAIYGLPKDLGPYSLAFNKGMLNDAIARAADNGVTIEYPSFTDPMTFSGFAEYLTTLKPYLVTNKNPKGYGISHFELMDAVWSNNADFFSADCATSKITEKNFVDAVQWIADLDLVHHVMPTTAEQNSQNGYQRFLNEGCLFTFMGPWDQKAWWANSIEFDIIPTPVGDAPGSKSTSWIGSVAYSIRADFKANESAKKDAAIKLAKWLTFSETCGVMNYQLGQAMPNVMSIAKTKWINNEGMEGRHCLPEHKQVWLDMTMGTEKVCSKNRAKYYLYNATCYDDLVDDLAPIWSGEKTAQQVLTSCNSKFQAGLDESRANLY